MKSITLALLAALTAASFAADTPADIAADYREKAAAALTKVNDTLEKATVPLIAALVKSGDTAGADLLKEQLKTKIAGEPVAAPQPSAAALFKSYDTARAKALEPAQKAAVARIDAVLASSEGKKLDVVTELGKVRAEIEAGKVSSAPVTNERYFVGKSWYTKAGSEYHFNKDGTGYRLQKMDFDDRVPFAWQQRPDGIVEAQQRKQPTAPPSATFFRFDDAKTGFQGTSDSNIAAPLTIR